MKCPRCGQPLEPERLGSITIERCAGCGGTWYDRGQLRLLKDRESHGDYRWIDIDLWRDRESFKVAAQEGLRCPKDGETLTTAAYGEAPVRVDICGRCGGVWLDGGEYKRIIEYLEGIVESRTAPEYIGDVRDEFVEALKGREGPAAVLGDIGKILYLLQLRFAVQHPDLVAFLRRTGRAAPGT